MFKQLCGVFIPSLLTLILFLSCAYEVVAVGASVQNNLMRSRDALLDQRAQLERADKELAIKVDDLQQQRSRINMYLKDIDRSIRDLDMAIQAQDSARFRH